MLARHDHPPKLLTPTRPALSITSTLPGDAAFTASSEPIAADSAVAPAGSSFNVAAGPTILRQLGQSGPIPWGAPSSPSRSSASARFGVESSRYPASSISGDGGSATAPSLAAHPISQ